MNIILKEIPFFINLGNYYLIHPLARKGTYLQTQLNKACKKSDKRANGDVNPKDFILFGKKDFKVVQTWKDNTGEKKYIEDMAFPTLSFPSDHGISTTILDPIAP